MDAAAVDARIRGRGGALQQHAHASRTGQSGSVLASRLVELWSWGAISAPILQWLSEGALVDLDSPQQARVDIERLAGIGAEGEWAGNTRRDLLTVLSPEISLPSALTIRVPYVHKADRSNEVRFTDASVMMPNEVFDALHRAYPAFFRRFLADGLRDFWSKINRANDPVAHGHPVFDAAEYESRAVPLQILGDKVRYTEEGDSIHCLAWTPLHSAGFSWQRYFFLAAFPAHSCAKDRIHGVSTMKIFWDYISLGFAALARGFTL